MSRTKKPLIPLPTGISGLFIFVSIFFFFKCSDPLAFLLEDTAITADRESITLDEGGKEDSIAFRLKTSPVDDKTVVIAGEIACEDEAQKRRISVDKNTITFTKDNWMSWLRFVFTAPENLRQESKLACEFKLNPSGSTDPGFSGQKIKSITITVRDNDGDSNIRLSTTNITISEGMEDNYTIRLTNQPENDVTVNTIPTGNLPKGLPPPIIQPLAVTFTPENYDQPQTVTITYTDDNQYFGNFEYKIKHRIVTVDPVYAAVADINFPEVGINLEDNDTYHVNVSQRSILRFDDVQGDTGASYTISLPEDFPPASGKDVKVLISNRNSGTFEVTPTSVSFSSGDWAPKVITVRRVNGNTSGSVNSDTDTITHTIDTTSSTRDTNYDSASIAPVDVIMDCTLSIDCDRDGLIDIKNAEMLNNMRYNLAGSSYKTSPTAPGDTTGCPTNNSGMRPICRGYGLVANIDLLTLLDDGGRNDVIDTKEVIVQGVAHEVIDTSKDKSWVPVGDNSTNSDASRFTGIFDGNGHTIANLWVNITSTDSNLGAGLFGYTGTQVIIRNVGIISGSIHGSFSDSGSAASGIFSSGGLVGIHRGDSLGDDLYIINSYVAGSSGVSASYSSGTPSGVTVSSGGLVGYTSWILNITNSYFSGLGGIASASSNPRFNSTSSGGLVGFVALSLDMENSYFAGSGGIASGSTSGGLMGGFLGEGTFTITNSYWNTDAPQSAGGSHQTPKRARGDVNAMNQPPGATGLTLAQLKATSGTNHPSGLPNGANDSTKPWDLGRANQLPAVKICKIPMGIPDRRDCDSYEELLSGQR